MVKLIFGIFNSYKAICAILKVRVSYHLYFIYCGSNIILNCMNCFWFFKIFKGFLKHLKSSKLASKIS